MRRQILLRAAQLGTLCALLAVGTTLARHYPDGETVAETAFLLALASGVIGSLALSSRTAPMVVLGGAVAGLLLLMPAAQGTRGALMLACLVVLVGWCSRRIIAGGPRLGWLDAVALAWSWQLLARSERFVGLEWTPQTMVWLFALPCAFGVTCAWWSRRESAGATRVAVVAGSLLLLVPGIGVVALTVLMLVAALESSRDRAAWSLALAAGAVGAWHSPGLAVAFALLAAAIALRDRAGWRWLPAGLSLAWALAFAPSSAAALAWAVIALPGVVWVERRYWPWMVSGVALALGFGDPSVPATLAPGIGLVALAVTASPVGARRHGDWTLVLLTLTTLAAAYPWLRPAAVGWLVPALGSPAAIVVTGLGVALTWAGLSRAGLRSAAWAVLVAVLLVAAQPAGRTLLDATAVVLDAEGEPWRSELPDSPVRRLVIDSFLTSATPERGATVASIRLIAADGTARRLMLHDDGLAVAHWKSPTATPWISWLTGDGRLASRYRAGWEIEPPFPAVRIEIERGPGLAAEASLALIQVATR